MKFGPFIRSKRLEQGITQRAFAKQVDIAPDHLGKIEREVYAPPSPDTVRRIAQALQLDESQMHALADESRPPERDRAITPETRIKIGAALRNRAFSAEHLAHLREARQRVLERTGRKKKALSHRSICGFCRKLGPKEQKTAIRYEDENLNLALCPDCFADWQDKPDDAVIVTGARHGSLVAPASHLLTLPILAV